MSPAIEYASGHKFDLEARLRNADKWYKSRGLPTLAERRAGRGGLATARRVYTKPPVKAAPKARTGPTVYIIPAPGGGRDQRGALEAFGSGAWDPEELNDPGAWSLQSWGHTSDSLDVSGPNLRATVDAAAGLVLEWFPDYRRADHRNVVSDLEKGRDSASVAFKQGTTLTLRSATGEARSLIVQARLIHVALLRDQNDRPLYPGSCCYVSYAKGQTDRLRDRRRAIDKALTRARAADHA